MKRAALAFAVLLLGPAGLPARVVEGVDVAEASSVSGMPLVLNGTAVGKATFLGIKCWSGGFYAPRRVSTAEEAAVARPLRFDFTFLRAISAKNNVKAWTAYFKEFSAHRYPGLDEELEAFYKTLDAFPKGTVQTFELEGDESRFYQGGKLKRTFRGKEFQKNFLSLWFGDLPAQREIKRGFLGTARGG